VHDQIQALEEILEAIIGSRENKKPSKRGGENGCFNSEKTGMVLGKENPFRRGEPVESTGHQNTKRNVGNK